jgi:septal ring factor EnvC (AmiA/AmiB activator)
VSVRPLVAIVFLGVLTAGVSASAQDREKEAAKALALAKREAAQSIARSQRFERRARAATSEAAKARAEAAALAARIDAAEAEITAADTRVRSIEALRAQQRARLAERQEPVVRLTAALQTMGRRPPALALVQPGSLHDLVHVRALLASTLPVIRQRTAALREEVEAGNRLRMEAETAVATLVQSRERLRQRRLELARFEAEQRLRSERLASSALRESDRALALGEEAQDLSARVDSLGAQARLRERLAAVAGPALRPKGSSRPAPTGDDRRALQYLLPVNGRLVTGVGEISDAGVHARGLTFETAPNTPVIAPASGQVVYAGRFRGYGDIAIIDHGNGWTSAITGLRSLEVATGARIRRGNRLGISESRPSQITVELRHNNIPFPITPLLVQG